MSIRAPRKGENYELSVDLNSEYREKRKDAIKRVIASMTVGKGMWKFELSFTAYVDSRRQMSVDSSQTFSRTCKRKILSRRSLYIYIL